MSGDQTRCAPIHREEKTDDCKQSSHPAIQSVSQPASQPSEPVIHLSQGDRILCRFALPLGVICTGSHRLAPACIALACTDTAHCISRYGVRSSACKYLAVRGPARLLVCPFAGLLGLLGLLDYRTVAGCCQRMWGGYVTKFK